jgi:uncharacterized protein involved in outer membrane biogenesis
MTRRRAVRWSIIAAVPVVVIILVIAFWNWDWFVPLVDRQASAALGRPVRIAHLHVRLGRVTTVTVDDLTVGNPAGFPDPAPLAQAAHVSASLDVMAYLRNRAIVIPGIDLNTPRISAIALPDGKNNYTFSFGGGSSDSKPGSTTAAPQIGNLSIEDGQAHVVQPKLRADFNLAIATRQSNQATAEREGQAQQIVVDAKGTYAGQPITGSLVGGALLSLRDAAHPYPVDLQLANGPTHVTLVGTIQDPLAFKGTDLKLDFSGPDMSLLYPLTAIPIPKTPSYRITGDLDYADHRIRFRDFSGVVGNSDLEGTISEQPGAARPDVTMELTSRRVDLADLGGFIGTPPGRKDEKNETAAERATVAHADASAGILPTQKINIPKLNAADIHLKYRGEHIEGRSIPFDRIDVALDVVDGRVTLHPLSLGVGTGQIAGDIDLAPVGTDEEHAKADINFERVDLSRIMAATHVFQGGGSIGGRAVIDTTGNSVATFLGNGNGGLSLYMSGGDLSALLVDLTGFEFGNALLSALGIPTKAQVQCFIGDFGLEHGLVTTRTLLLDTSEAVIHGSGTVNLRDQRVDYQIDTKAKHFTIGSLPAPIDITGTLGKPSIMPDVKALGVRGGLAAGLGILAAPLALLPTIQFGTGDTHQCGDLLQETRAAAADHPGVLEPAHHTRR